MSQELCPECGELTEHGGVYLDGEPMPAGCALLQDRPRTRVCMNCRPYTGDPDEKPCPAGWYADLYAMRDEMRWGNEYD